jgi:hypothetical protein
MLLSLAWKDLSASLNLLKLLLCFAFAIASLLFLRGGRGIKAPYAGYRSWFEPTFLVRARFFANAQSIISSGYKKVSKTH